MIYVWVALGMFVMMALGIGMVTIIELLFGQTGLGIFLILLLGFSIKWVGDEAKKGKKDE